MPEVAAGNSTTEAYASLLRRCASEKNLDDGRKVHEHLAKKGYGDHTFLANVVVQMYGKCGSVQEAVQVFERISHRDLFSWNIMIAAYAENGHLDEALRLFDQMQVRDVVTWNAIIAAYVQNGQLDFAGDIFASMPERNVVSWNSLIAAYAQNGEHLQAFHLFWTMSLEGTKPNDISFINVLEICTVSEGRVLQWIVSCSDFCSSVKVLNALITMYGECGSIADAEQTFDKMRDRDVVTWTTMLVAYARNGLTGKSRKVFDEMPSKNVVTWNSMIWAYAEAGNTQQALEVFHAMKIKPNRATFVSVLGSGLGSEEGKKVHGRIRELGFETNVMVATALCGMYGSCGSVEEARRVFDGIQKLESGDLISWNCMITVYSQNCQSQEALEIFHRMNSEGVTPNDITFLNALDACASLSSRSEGACVHRRVEDSGLLNSEVKVGNAVMNMYGKCGNLSAANQVFERMPRRDILSWNVMITSYGQNGLGAQSVDWFLLTLLEGFNPDSVTFLAVLSACSHAGLLEKGVSFFNSIREDWEMEPNGHHYLCVIDLLGRAGELKRSEELVETMPFEPEEGAWRALLGGCRINIDIQRGERATQSLLLLDSEDSSTYVLMSHIYASTEQWESAGNMRRLMAERNVKKQPGLSWIEIRGKTHTFAANDKSHPRKDEIYAALQDLFEQLTEVGYEPDIALALHDVSEDEKVRMVLHHSEKLAIVFGMISTPDGAPLFVLKNLRVCSDCHTATKLISKISGRRIVMRDGSRFHHFEGGGCSCGDYW